MSGAAGGYAAGTRRRRRPSTGRYTARDRASSRIDLYTTEQPDDVAWLAAGMRRHELSLVPGLAPGSEDLPLIVIARDEAGRRAGGVKASLHWDGLEVEVLWTDESDRRRGVGSALLARVEAFAAGRGARVAFLETVDAVDFYRRHGYALYGVLDDRPVGTRPHHVKKRLDGTAG